jgi:hypothetical protein
MSDSSDAEVFIFAAVCEETEKRRKQKQEENVDARHTCTKM